MSVHSQGLRAKLERLESEYAEITDGGALITAQQRDTTKYQFADGGEAMTLEDAVKSAEALVKFARSMSKP